MCIWTVCFSPHRHWKLDILFYRPGKWVAFNTMVLWNVLLVFPHESQVFPGETSHYMLKWCKEYLLLLYWDGQALAQSGFLEWWEEGCILSLCMCEWSKWGFLCCISYWSRTPEIAMLKNTVIGALRSVTVIRHGTWLPVLHSESTGREGIRRHSKGTEQLQKQCFSVEKLKMNSKEGRLCIQEKSRVKLLVLLTKG